MSTTEYPSLAAALAAVQAKLPSISKGETAEVEGKSKTGVPFKYKYSYADLADISKVILPMLGAVGLSWVTKPTFNEAGKFVLVYKLQHEVDGEEAGEYPLPQNGSPQEIGSAITYARRYALCSVTGVAPEQDDDDGATASQRPAQRWDDAKPARPYVPSLTEVRSLIAAAGKDRGMELDAVAADFESWSKGAHIRATDDVRLLGDYLEHLKVAS